MKSLLKITSSLLAIIIALGLTSCSDENGIFVETEIIRTEETELFENTASLITSSDTLLVNCFLFFCPFNNGNLTSYRLIYGEGLELGDGEFFSDTLYMVQNWIAQETGLEEGLVFLSETQTINPITGTSTFSLSTIDIASGSEEFALGSFMSTDTLSNANQTTGSFFATPLPCFNSTIDVERSTQFVSGRATINSNITLATNGLCDEVFTDLGLDSLVSFFFLGGFQEIDEGGNTFFEPENIEQVIFSTQEKEFIVGETYEAWMISEPEEYLETQIGELTFQESVALGEPILISYTSLSETYNSGQIFNAGGELIGTFTASVFSCQ